MTIPEHDLTEYALALRYEDIDPIACGHVSDIVFDTLGIAVGAYVQGHESGKVCEDYMLERFHIRDATGDAVLWSGRGTACADEVALCNGTWAEILDYQDVVVDARNAGHAGVTIVPAAVAAAEAAGAGGRELIVAITAGLEVTLAVLRAVGGAHRANGRGFRTSSIGSPIGATVACARLLGLDLDRTLNAMGIVGACANKGLMPSLSPGNGDFGGDKDWVNGLSAQLAVNAAMLAGRGLTGSREVITGDRGIIASHSEGDAQPLAIPESGAPNIGYIALKKYPACYGVHAAVEAALAQTADDQPSPEAIERVIVRVKASSLETLDIRKLTNHMAARFSLPYCVAAALVRRRLTLEDFQESALVDPVVLDLMTRVEIVGSEEMTRFNHETGAFPAIVEITAGGRSTRGRVDFPIGSEQNPMSRDELVDKFKALTKGHWETDRQDRIIEAALSIEDLDDVRSLTRML